jgi:hypothetical protein
MELLGICYQGGEAHTGIYRKIPPFVIWGTHYFGNSSFHLYLISEKSYLFPRRTIYGLRHRFSLKTLQILRKYIENIHIIGVLQLYGLN